MHRVVKIAVVLAMLVGLIGTAHATTNILYYTDIVPDTDRMAEALASLVAGGGYSYTTATGLNDFATQIAVPDAYNLAIFMVQSNAFDLEGYWDGINALVAFVAAGGRSIYTNCSGDELGVLGALFTGATGYLSFTVTVTGPLAAGITNPVALDKRPSAGDTLATGLGVAEGFDGVVAATFSGGDGAIVICNIDEGGLSITNGFMSDTFSDGPTGVQLYRNEIKYLTDPVPLPGAVWLLGSGLLGLGLFRGRMRKD